MEDLQSNAEFEIKVQWKEGKLSAVMGRQPHVLVIPYPAQGHVMPLMKLSMKLAEHGVKVTFVNTQFIEAKIMASVPEKSGWGSQMIRLVSIPDGIEQGDDRKDAAKTRECMLRAMPGHLKNLIEKVNQSSGCEQIRCVMADPNAGWALEVARKMGIPGAAVMASGPGNLVLSLNIPKLIEAGIIDNNGTPLSDELISLSDETPAWKVNELTWSCPSDPKTQKIFFEYCTSAFETPRNSNWVLCNSFDELDSSARDLFPNMLTIGPLLASDHSGGHLAANFWPEDSTCLSWLDKQAKGSVIYVSFGSIAKISQKQFDELALGLESLEQPFLWVVRKDLVKVSSMLEFPVGFTERVAGRGKVVEWAPQEQVLAHSSVACFLSHCGWNSTMESLSMGVPFLCWPYFADQFHNRSYICDAWKVGLELQADRDGIITRHEFETKIKTLLTHDAIRANALKFKKMARESIAEGGSSFRNFQSFIAQISEV